MKEKLKKLLKEHNVDAETSKIISDVVCEAFDTMKSKIDSYEKEQTEALELVEHKIKQLKTANNEQLLEQEEKWKNVLETTKKQVTKTIEEDYIPYKKKLTTKVKNFLSENMKSIHKVIKEQLEESHSQKEIETAVEKLEQISEAVKPFIGSNGNESEESKAKIKQLKEALTEVTGKIKKMEEGYKKLSLANKSLLNENKKLQEVVNTPLKKKIAENVKLDNVDTQQEADDEDNQVLFEMKRLIDFN